MKPETEAALAERLMASKAGREVSPDTALSAVRWALARYAPADAEKAAKTRLHQFYGSWVGEGWARKAQRILDALERGGQDAGSAAQKLLALHASTRERLPFIGKCYEHIFACCGKPASVLDAACGLNPLSFALPGMPDASILAVDAGVAVAETLNRFFVLAGMQNSRAEAGDILGSPPTGRFDLALVMKFLPLAERMEKGGAVKLLDSIDAVHTVVSFPTRSLSGKNVGMERNYSQWFEGLEFNGEIVERFVCGEEIFYIIKGSHSIL
jgi:16S rRNA (guanine(1405)-N(7))-methyltransferase